MAIAGLIGGVVLGFAARWGRFCTLGAIEDWVLGHDSTRLRGWLLALSVAVIGTHLAALVGLVPLAESAYLYSPPALYSTFFGSVLFGLGMALLGTCGFGLLARLGGGDLKSLFGFFAVAVCAYSSMRGLLAYPRRAIFEGRTLHEVPQGFAYWLEREVGGQHIYWGICIGLLLLVAALASRRLWLRPRIVVTGVVVGLTVAGGWISTSYLSNDFDPHPLESFSFVAPLGETLLYVMATTGSGLRFGIGAVVGVVIGAFIGSRNLKQFRWEACDDAREIGRQMLGGLLMGFGGVVAFGCTVGQGLSAASILAFSAPVALLGIYIGAWLGLQWMVNGDLLSDLNERCRSIFQRSQKP